MASNTRRLNFLLPSGTYWCAVVSYIDNSGLLGVYGPYPTEEIAIAAGSDLQDAGVHRNDKWEFVQLRLIDLGNVVS
jgi:hypothetical protein